MSERPDIEVRNLRFKFDESIPRHWNGGSESGTAFFDSQSLLFPAGERFFVRSVVALLPKIRDPELLRKARAFCGQEGMHTREHVHYNRRLQALGYPAARLERWVANFLRLVWWTTLPRWRLAITCAIEHFTAIGAARALGSQGLDAAEPRMRAFWRWHAAEELEHKSIPFDIYQAVGGNYVERIAIMFIPKSPTPPSGIISSLLSDILSCAGSVFSRLSCSRGPFGVMSCGSGALTVDHEVYQQTKPRAKRL